MPGDNLPVTAPVGPGDVLAGKYQVERVLGEGGMGIVVAARHMQLGQRVALKFMLPAAMAQRGAAERFLREAKAAARLRSEHVARVIDVGTLENGAPYTVMEFLEGSDLGRLLEERGPLPVPQAVTYILQACVAMDEAHKQKVVHRDIKPENLFLTRRPDGRPLVKVLDFGISKILDGTSELSTTRTGMAMGSPAYMAPEQMKSAKDADARADIWSLGAVLFQLVSGRLPYEAETFTEMMARVLTEDPRSLGDVDPKCDPGLAAVVRHCLERDREGRIQSVPELVAALAPYGGPESHAIVSSVGDTAATFRAPSVVQGTATPPAIGQVVAEKPQGGRAWVAVVGGLVAVAALATVLVRSGTTPATAERADVADAGPSAQPTGAVAAAPDAAAAAVVDASVPVADASPPDASPPDAAPKKPKKRRRRRQKKNDDDPFGSIH